MDVGTLKIASQIAQILGWPIALFMVWALTRNNKKNDAPDKSKELESLAYEFRNLANAYKEQTDHQIELMRETNEALRLIVASTAKNEAKLAEILERLRQ